MKRNILWINAMIREDERNDEIKVNKRWGSIGDESGWDFSYDVKA